MDRVIGAARDGRAPGAAAAHDHAATGPSTSPTARCASRRGPTPSWPAGATFVARRHAARRRQGRLRRGLERAQRAEVLDHRPRPGRVHPAARRRRTAWSTRSRPSTQVVSGGLNGNDIGFLEQDVRGRGHDRAAGQLRSTRSGCTRSPAPLRPTRSTRPRSTSATPTGSSTPTSPGFEALHDVMAENGDDDMPVYITQFGYTVRAAEDHGAGPGRRPGRDYLGHGLRAGHLRAATSAACRGTPSTRHRGTRRPGRCWTRQTGPTSPTPPSRSGPAACERE